MFSCLFSTSPRSPSHSPLYKPVSLFLAHLLAESRQNIKKNKKNKNTHMLRNIPTLSSSEQRLNMFGFF